MWPTARIGLMASAPGSGVFGRALQVGQRVGRARHEPPSEYRLEEPAPPTWRELEGSVERDATRVGTRRRNLDDLAVRHAERQANVNSEAMWPNRSLHSKRHLHVVPDASAKHQPVPGTQLAVRRLDHLRIRPPGQSLRRGDETPHSLGRRMDDVGRTDV